MDEIIQIQVEIIRHELMRIICDDIESHEFGALGYCINISRSNAFAVTMNELSAWRELGERLEPLLSRLLFNAGESGELVSELRARQAELTDILKGKTINLENSHE